MKNIKKFLFFFFILFTFSFSVGENKVILDNQRKEPAKLKIGVTKIKSKELPMDFDVESKKIYGEIEIEDNDLVFVSETLDEIPSVSTTNGRRVINNINKYLTKNIKKSPKFNYQIVDGKTESGEKNGKKYLLIDCKEQLSSVYVYVLEKGTYKIKNVYKGAFKQLLNSSRDVAHNYGMIGILKDTLDSKKYKRISYGVGGISISKAGNYSEKDEEALQNKKIILRGNYPKKLEDGGKFQDLINHPAYQIVIEGVDGTPGSIESGILDLKGDNKNIINYQTVLDSKDSKNAIRMNISTDDNGDYYYIDLVQMYSYEALKYKITIIYGKTGGLNAAFYGSKEIHTFNIEIEGKEKPILPENTEGTVVLKNKIKNLGGPTLKDTVLTFNEKGDPIFLDNRNTLFEEEGFPKLIGKSVEILDYIKYRNEFANTEDNYLRVSYDANNEKGKRETWHKDITLGNKEINFTRSDFGDHLIYNRYGEKIGEISVTGKFEKAGKFEKDKKNYFNIEFLASGKNSSYWSDTYKEVTSTLTFEYYSKGNNGSDKLLKKDILNLAIVSVDENIAPDTRGTLFITKSYGLPGKDLFIKNGKLEQAINDNDGANFSPSQASFTGELPTCFASNNSNQKGENWVNFENGYRLVIDSLRGGNNIPTRDFDYKTGKYDTDGPYGNWIPLRFNPDDGYFDDLGFIYFSSDGIVEDKNRDSIVIGFRSHYLESSNQNSDFSWHKKDEFYERYEFKYQVDFGGEWHTIKTDILELIIKKDYTETDGEISLKNPLVYYDYDSSSALSNVVHQRRVHLSEKETKTLNNTGTVFTKNTNLLGKDWIEATGIKDYALHNKHKVSIVRGNNEVVKNTKDDGGTISSTYLSGDDIGDVNHSKSEVMFSYDGGNQYLNFGLSKYNFDKDDINNIVVTHFDKTGNLRERKVYNVHIPAFEGIHYMGNYDIKPGLSYTKNYTYDPTIGNQQSFEIDYGRVGFRNLDTRITNQSGGEGIDFRVTRKVKLESVSIPGYVIKGVEMYFEKDKEEPNDDGGETSRFKGENERATSAMLKLRIPAQETLIPKGKFKILTDHSDDKKNNNNPLRIGVTVEKDKEKYYTYVDNEDNKDRGENLYLNLTVNRFFETVIEFENPDLKIDEKGENWINLDSSGGKLSRPIMTENGSSNLWGRVRGDLIDIPVDKYSDLRMVIFSDKDGKEEILKEELNVPGGRYEFGLLSDENNKKFIISRDKKEDKHIRFTLNDGYTINQEKDIKFYMRYFGTKKQEPGKPQEKEQFLFDQRYIVKFKDKVDYKGDTTVIIKNPNMAKSETSDDGMINVSTNTSLANDNSKTNFDSIKWYNVANQIETYPEKLLSLVRIDENGLQPIDEKDYKEFIKIENNKLHFGIPNNKDRFRAIFGEEYSGKKVEKSFELRFSEDNMNSYRLNVVIDKFDPKYYGKVFVEDNDTIYNEINKVGNGSIDLTQSNLKDGAVYVDLGTWYRDYLRYASLPTTLLNNNGNLIIKAEGEVEAIPQNSDYAEPVKGHIVFYDKESHEIIPTTDGKEKPQNYSLRLKLTPKEYKKLKPYTEYHIFLNGNPNVLTIGVDTLKDNILFDKPLNFTTKGPGIEIETTVLDFGQIKPKDAKEPMIIVPGTTNREGQKPIRVKLGNGGLDSDLGITTQTLVVERDTIYIKQLTESGKVKVNGGELKVRDLKTEKRKAVENPQGKNTEIIEEYDISGILEVPKNIDESNYGEYKGTVTVTYTFE